MIKEEARKKRNEAAWARRIEKNIEKFREIEATIIRNDVSFFAREKKDAVVRTDELEDLVAGIDETMVMRANTLRDKIETAYISEEKREQLRAKMDKAFEDSRKKMFDTVASMAISISPEVAKKYLAKKEKAAKA